MALRTSAVPSTCNPRAVSKRSTPHLPCLSSVDRLFAASVYMYMYVCPSDCTLPIRCPVSTPQRQQRPRSTQSVMTPGLPFRHRVNLPNRPPLSVLPRWNNCFPRGIQLSLCRRSSSMELAVLSCTKSTKLHTASSRPKPPLSEPSRPFLSSVPPSIILSSTSSCGHRAAVVLHITKI